MRVLRLLYYDCCRRASTFELLQALSWAVRAHRVYPNTLIGARSLEYYYALGSVEFSSYDSRQSANVRYLQWYIQSDTVDGTRGLSVAGEKKKKKKR